MQKILAAAFACVIVVSPAWAAGDASKGEAVFKRCTACHAVGEGAKNKVGPELNGIVGRKVAAAPGFNYSTAFKAKGEEGWSWDETHLTAYLADPKGYVPGTKMAFPGLKKPDEIADVITYLETFKTP